MDLSTQSNHSLVKLIGNTPLVELNKLNPNPQVKVLAKLEGTNPGGSVKDRAAYYMIKNSLAQGLITPKTHIIEPTSGNTGIALAMMSSIYGLNIELVMPENSSIERVQAMEMYGAKVTLTSIDLGMEGAIDYAHKVLNESPDKCYMFNQFSNPNNPLAHYEGTGPEIWRDTSGEVSHFISSMGTTGTIVGTSKYLKEQNPNIKIIGLQPDDQASIPGIRKWTKEYLPKIYTDDNVDKKLDIKEEDAINTMKLLAKKEGISCGPSSGGAAFAALELAKTIDNSSLGSTKATATIVFIVCDRGDRYLSMNY